jgi:5'-methylthioinosine phosphorylase
MVKIGIIGGSGFGSIQGLEITHREMVSTSYGAPSCPVAFGDMCGSEIVFIARHGIGHTVAPHIINYRANLAAMKQMEVTHIIAINAVGGITEKMSPLKLVFPDQIIDYTHSRKSTYYDKHADLINHVDFTYPYEGDLCRILAGSAKKNSIDHEINATYGATQGPRLETAAEVDRMRRDGCDIVGMTGMPEAILARELGMKYACCAIVVNWAAGRNEGETISMEDVNGNLKKGSRFVHLLLESALPEMMRL